MSADQRRRMESGQRRWTGQVVRVDSVASQGILDVLRRSMVQLENLFPCWQSRCSRRHRHQYEDGADTASFQADQQHLQVPESNGYNSG